MQKSLVFSLFLALTFACGAAKAQTGDDFKKKLDNAIESSQQQRNTDKEELRRLKVNAPIVVELFTTSDCSACIFSDRILYDTLKNKNVIGLSCHIQDTGALITKYESEKGDLGKVTDGPMDPCVFRQWAYKGGRSAKDVSLNIPNFVFNGTDHLGSESLNLFDRTLDSYNYAYKNKTLEVFMKWKDDDTITVHLPQHEKFGQIDMNASVWIIRYKDMAVEKIDTGINAGRVLRFSNIIQDIRHIAKWHGATRIIDVDVAKPQGGKERGGYVVLVQEMMGDPVLAAGKLVDYPHPDDVKKAASTKPAAKMPLVVPAPATPSR